MLCDATPNGLSIASTPSEDALRRARAAHSLQQIKARSLREQMARDVMIGEIIYVCANKSTAEDLRRRKMRACVPPEPLDNLGPILRICIVEPIPADQMSWVAEAVVRMRPS